MRFKSFVFTLFFIFGINFLVQALNPKDEGVCESTISQRKSRTKLVTLNKKCGKKKCVAKKTEFYTQTTKRHLCCKGWGYDTDLDKCTPICSTGCEGGKCTAPDVCTCDPPSYINPERKNVCIQPTCDPPCVNGICIANNTCQCHQDFYQHNSSYCSKCQIGFEMIENVCQPICDKGCGPNGNCSAPNVCTCNEGYKLNNSTCEPICEPTDCINATCIAPNVCECFEGYEKLNDSTCGPLCENCSGECIGPNICQCGQGYTNVVGECRLSCNVSCVNGHCLGSDECACDPGYVKNGSDANVCVRDCHQAAFDTLTEQAMMSIKLDRRSRKTCPPKTIPCTPAQEEKLKNYDRSQYLCCAKPKGPIKKTIKTLCCDGWMYVNDTCKPICRKGCNGGGYCASPGVCKCDPPLVLINENTCGKPSCDPPCVNGQCVDTNECSCNPNHSKHNATHCAPTCGSGLFLDVTSLTCKPPSCNPPCKNGQCTAPNECTCNKGFVQDNSTKCSPKCECDCFNGICTAPNTCTCKTGYETVNSTYCKPKCDECENGKCMAPNLCECNEGYSLKNGSKICTPVCNKECVNATCESPNKCACNTGYETTEDDAVCRPKCYACEHGDCIAPLNCQCHDGYNRGMGGCLPVCPEPCVNGECTEPNICSCQERYQKNSTHASVCFKRCEGPCEFGRCSLQGECICDRGYELKNGSCFALTAVDCSTCEHNCTYGECYCSDNSPCNLDISVEEGLTSAGTGLAGLELTWILCGVALLLLVVLVVVMQGIWRRRKQIEGKADQCQNTTYSSVMFTMPDTLMQKNIPEEIDEEGTDALDDCSAKTANEELLHSESAEQP